jgi:hypothetical protein
MIKIDKKLNQKIAHGRKKIYQQFNNLRKYFEFQALLNFVK